MNVVNIVQAIEEWAKRFREDCLPGRSPSIYLWTISSSINQLAAYFEKRWKLADRLLFMAS